MRDEPGKDTGSQPATGHESPVTGHAFLLEALQYLHTLHGVPGEVRPDHRIAHQLFGASVHHAALGAVNFHVEPRDALDDVGRIVHHEPGVRGVLAAVVQPGDAHHVRAQRLGQRVHLVDLELDELVLHQVLAGALVRPGPGNAHLAGVVADPQRV